MSAQKRTASSVLGAALGTLGFSVLAGVLVTVMVAPAIAVTGMTANNSLSVFENLPDYITLSSQKQQNEIYITGADGNPLRIAVVFDQNRQELPLASMSPFLSQAAIAGEDRRFEEHGGIDIPSVARAAVGVVTKSSESGGASTLTMQTVRNILVQEAVNNPENDTAEKRAKAVSAVTTVSLSRKLKEMKLAISLEKQYSKDEILQGYLNIAGFGNNTYGVQAAAFQYFGLNAADVNVAQAASIIAIVQDPNKLNLGNEANFARNQARRDKIIRDMHTVGFITTAQRDEALAIPVDANFISIHQPQSGCRYADVRYRSFCDYILKSVPDLTSLGSTEDERLANWRQGGYKLTGTLDVTAQEAAFNAVQRYVPASYNATQVGAAAVSVQAGTGAILTMAQSKLFDDGLQTPDPTMTAVNFSADYAHGRSKGFQPGSTYKPYTLLAWLEAGLGLKQTFNASIKTLPMSKFKDSCNGSGGGTYKFRNDSRADEGNMSIPTATGRSVNSVFLQMATKVDQCSIRQVAQKLGVHDAAGALDGSDMQTLPSCVVGGCETNIAPITQAAAYAAIANQGVFCSPVAVKQIVGPDGVELPAQNAECHQAIDPNVANAATDAMETVMRATASRSNPNDGTPYIGKTGTTNDAVHTWMVGSSTAVGTAVWVGNIQGDANLRKIKIGGTQAAVLRHDIFKPIARAIDARYPGTKFAAPDASVLNGKPTFVPNVAGSTLAKAQATIENSDLVFADGGQVDSDKPVGTVVRTDPAGGTSTSIGNTVTVFTSNGQGVSVPDVSSGKNQDFNAAKGVLTSAGFTDVQQACQAGKLPTDPDFNKVVAQDPAGGTLANKATKITLTIAKATC